MRKRNWNIEAGRCVRASNRRKRIVGNVRLGTKLKSEAQCAAAATKSAAGATSSGAAITLAALSPLTSGSERMIDSEVEIITIVLVRCDEVKVLNVS